MFVQNITEPKVFLGGYVKRLSANFGLNSSATTLELDLIEGHPNNPYDVSVGATGIDTTGIVPGNVHKFELGAFKFVGMIQSWNKSIDSNGTIWNVRLADPRILYNNVILNLNGNGLSTGVQLTNYLNVFNYYQNPIEADSTDNGMTFAKIRDYLTATGVFNLFNNKFILQFSSGFLNYSSGNLSGIPTWYRINSDTLNLEGLLSQVGTDFGCDYFAHITYDSFNPTGTSPIFVQDISRVGATGLYDIQVFVDAAKASGALAGHKIGQELRLEPTTYVLYGPKLTYWKCPQANEIQQIWGRYNDGTLITTELTETFGIVTLDHITGSGSERITNTVTIPKITLTKVTGVNNYPPGISRFITTQVVSGYQVTENTMRAALFSQNAWEAVLFKENQTFAESLGITAQRFMGQNEFILKPLEIRYALDLSRVGSGISDRTQITDNLINAVYQATKETVDNYYGKGWLLKAGASAWLASGTVATSELVPRIEFSPAQYAWSEPNKATPSGATLNYFVLQDNKNPNFKDNVGRTTAFLGVPNYDTKVDNLTFPYPVDFSSRDLNSVILDQSSRMAVPISITAYDKDPTRFITQLDNPIEGLPITSGYENQKAFYSFLRYFDYSHDEIVKFNLMDTYGTNSDYGLAPPRLHANVPYSSNIYGFFINIQRNDQNFGGFIASGSLNGGVNIVEDSSLAPWTYGSIEKFNEAGQLLANRAGSSNSLLSSSELNIIGLPVFNLGDLVGINSVVSALSIQYGVDGFTTNYQLKTYTVPQQRLIRLLTDKINSNYNKILYNQKQIVDLNKALTEESDPITKPSQIPTKVNKGQSVNTGQTVGIVIPHVSGVYNPNLNPMY